VLPRLFLKYLGFNFLSLNNNFLPFFYFPADGFEPLTSGLGPGVERFTTAAGVIFQTFRF
jgi:hypothetical protein